VDEQITVLLKRMSAGDPGASGELMPVVYAELRRIAGLHLRNERQDHTLQPTALVNEAYLRMFGHVQPQFSDRAHFLALTSRIMRGILVDHARSRSSAKRGGDARRVDPDLNLTIAVDGADHLVGLLDLHLALEELSAEHPNPAQAVEMRYFGGMTAEETAEAVGRTVHVVQHELRFAHSWLRRRLSQTP
jgi:RNA polymerase sigma-70 factor, ECF subfamily